MAKIEFETSCNCYHPNFIDYKGKEPVEKTKAGWMGIDADTGVKISIVIEGPAKEIDKLLTTFPIGKAAKNIAVDVSLSCTQRTLTAALKDAAADADDKKAKDAAAADGNQTLDEALEKATQ